MRYIVLLALFTTAANAAPFTDRECEILHAQFIACAANCEGGTCSAQLGRGIGLVEDRHHIDIYPLCQRVRYGEVSKDAAYHQFCKKDK